jgi:hypothetical protein
LSSPRDVFADVSGRIFIADTTNNRIRIISIVGIINTFAGGGLFGYRDNVQATATALFTPWGVFVDPTLGVFIADLGSNTIRLVYIDK